MPGKLATFLLALVGEPVLVNVTPAPMTPVNPDIEPELVMDVAVVVSMRHQRIGASLATTAPYGSEFANCVA